MNYNTIGGKLRLIGLGDLHDLLNKVIDKNSPGAVRQQIRDLKEQRETVASGVADAITNIRIGNKDKREADDRIHSLETTLQNIKDDKKHDMDYKSKAATPLMREKMGLEQKVKSIGDDLATNAATKATLDEALIAVDSQIGDMEARLERLESTEHSASAKEAAAAALKNARESLSASDTSGVDSAISRAERRNTRASVVLEGEMESVKSTTSAFSKNTEVDAAVSSFLDK